MRDQIVLLTCLLAACGDPCIVETTEEEACPETDTGACLPVEQGHPYGPCDPEVGCGGPESICYEPAPAGNVCAKTCASDADCGEVEYCTPDNAPASCSVWGWCIVACDAADGACPGGMVCDLDLEGAAGLGICIWPGA